MKDHVADEAGTPESAIGVLTRDKVVLRRTAAGARLNKVWFHEANERIWLGDHNPSHFVEFAGSK